MHIPTDAPDCVIISTFEGSRPFMECVMRHNLIDIKWKNGEPVTSHAELFARNISR